MRSATAAALAMALLAAPAFAQESSTWNGLPDRFQVDAGYFHLNADTVLRFQGSPGSAGDVDFERDLGVPEKADTFWVDATWRVGRRHQLKLGFTRLSRDRNEHTLTRDFVWGGQTYTAGLRTTSETSSEILGGYYRFAAVRKERFELGPALGVGYLWLNARIEATGTVGGASRTLDRSASEGSVTGALGGYVNAWPARRMVVYGDFLYIKVKPENSDASVKDWRVGANYYFLRNLGLGVQYKYDRFSQHRDILSTKVGGDLTYKGFQAFVSFLF
jgi:predicted porin